MDEAKQPRRLRSYVIGGVLGASAAVAAVRRRRPPRRRQAATGLAAFESAPCYRESLERERSDGP
jgi:hypothetical protein